MRHGEAEKGIQNWQTKRAEPHPGGAPEAKLRSTAPCREGDSPLTGRVVPESQLFLLSKGGTMTALDMRPLAVTNTDNRIIAKCMVLAITPALELAIDKHQLAS